MGTWLPAFTTSKCMPSGSDFASAAWKNFQVGPMLSQADLRYQTHPLNQASMGFQFVEKAF